MYMSIIIYDHIGKLTKYSRQYRLKALNGGIYFIFQKLHSSDARNNIRVFKPNTRKNRRDKRR